MGNNRCIKHSKQSQFFWTILILLLLVPHIMHRVLRLMYYDFNLAKIFSLSRLKIFFIKFCASVIFTVDFWRFGIGGKH